MALNPINGTPDPDLLQGTGVGDLIRAGAGDDVAQGLGGNDVLHGEAGDDELFGGDGNDRIYGGGDNDFISGDRGEDWLYGGDGDDYIAAGVFSNDFEENHAFGGAGDDTIEFYLIQSSNGEADGGDGIDTLRMGPVAFTREINAPVFASISGPGAGISYINDYGGTVTVSVNSIEILSISSSFGDDVISGGDYGDLVFAGDGANTVSTFGGDDLISYVHREPGQANTIDGGDDNDTLRIQVDVWGFEDPSFSLTVSGTSATDNFGAAISNVENFEVNGSYGDDEAEFGAGHDVFNGAAGADSAAGNDGDDQLTGGTGNDKLAGGEGSDSVDGGEGADILHGDGGDDTIIGGDGKDRITGGAGNDKIFLGTTNFLFLGTAVEVVAAGAGDDEVEGAALAGSALDGGAGFDKLFLLTYGASGPLTIDMSGQGPSDIVVRNFESTILRMAGWNDQVTGTDFEDDIDVGAGSNTVAAGSGDDIVAANFGSIQTLDGGTGNDTLRLTGLAGVTVDPMTFTVTSGDAGDSLGSTYIGFETYEVFGGDADDVMTLGTGNDRANGRRGGDTLAGADGNDVLSGGGGDDALDGGTGDDDIAGGIGGDTLTGGDGADRFRFGYFGTAEPADTITDMEVGEDRLFISRTYTTDGTTEALPRGILDSSRFAIGAATGSAGQFVYVIDAAGGHLLWDADGAGAGAGLEIALLQGGPVISAADIFLF